MPPLLPCLTSQSARGKPLIRSRNRGDDPRAPELKTAHERSDHSGRQRERLLGVYAQASSRYGPFQRLNDHVLEPDPFACQRELTLIESLLGREDQGCLAASLGRWQLRQPLDLGGCADARP